MSIEQLARHYNNFQNQFGQSLLPDYQHIIENLFSPQFKKIANGKELVSTRDELAQQLEDVRKMTGSWRIRENLIIPSSDNKKCTIRFNLSSENVGSFDVIAILTSINGKQIDAIDEIFYQI